MKNFFILTSLYFVLFGTPPAPKIYTIAGFSDIYGDGRNTDHAALYEPHGVTADNNGNLYYTEIYNHTICRMDTNKVVTVIAGKRYQAGYTGDGLRATEALLNSPAGITTDNAGNLYFADQGNHCIRKIDKTGIIHTVAGNGTAGYSGDGGDALHATLNIPQDVAFDKQGNLYIADPGSQRIRKVDAQGVITTYAGNGTAGFSGDSSLAIQASINNPQAIVVTKEGNLAIADCNNNRIRLVNKTTGIITTIAGNGKHPEFCNTRDKSENGLPATTAAIGEPTDIDVDSAGVLYIAESYSCNISTINAAGIFNRLNAYAESIYKLTVYKKANQLYFTTTNEDDCWGLISRIDQYNLSNEQQKDLLYRVGTYASPEPNSENKHFATLASVNPNAITFDQNGNMYIAERYAVKKVDSHGIITTFAGLGYSSGALDNGDGGSALKATFKSLSAIAADNKGNIYVADYGDKRIRKVDTKGIITTVAGNSAPGHTPDGEPAAGNPMYEPVDISVNDRGIVYYATTTAIKKINKRGLLVTIAGGGIRHYDPSKNNVPAKDASINYCRGLYVDSKEKSIYYTEVNYSIVRKIDSTGTVNTIAGMFYNAGFAGDGGPAVNAKLNGAYDVTKDQFGNVYITDANNRRIRHIAPDGIISTLAGSGAYEVDDCDGSRSYYSVYGGDGGLAANAALNFGSDNSSGYISGANITTDKEGNLYLAEVADGRIREVVINCKWQPAPFNSAAKQYLNANTVLSYGCNIVCGIQPSGLLSTALNTIVVAKVWVRDAPVRSKEERIFASRLYGISPEPHVSGATANIILYYTQAEFDTYNKAVNALFTKLPSYPDDTAGIANIRVIIANGNISDTTGFPDNYQSFSKIINPSAQNIQWNDSLHSWQVTVDANGFGGYFLSTVQKNVNNLTSEKDIVIPHTNIDVFPNPATDFLNINCTNDLLNTTYYITDATGRIILSDKISTLTQRVDISKFSPGMYFIKFSDNKVKKLIKY